MKTSNSDIITNSVARPTSPAPLPGTGSRLGLRPAHAPAARPPAVRITRSLHGSLLNRKQWGVFRSARHLVEFTFFGVQLSESPRLPSSNHAHSQDPCPT